MPDRYGEADQPEAADARDARLRAASDAAAMGVSDCELCDPFGYRGGHPCDHIDHASAAARGMAMIRKAMGWT